jgi:hypothetical protein
MVLDGVIGMGVPDMALDDNGCVNQFESGLGEIRLDGSCIEEDVKPFLSFYRELVYKDSREKQFLVLSRYVRFGPHSEKLFYLVSCGFVPFEYGQTVDDRTGFCLCWVDYWSLDEYSEGRFCFSPQSCARDLAVKYKGLIWYFDDMMGNKFFSKGGGAE